MKTCKFCPEKLEKPNELFYGVCYTHYLEVLHDKNIRCFKCGRKIKSMMGKVNFLCAECMKRIKGRVQGKEVYTAQDVIDEMEKKVQKK